MLCGLAFAGANARGAKTVNTKDNHSGTAARRPMTIDDCRRWRMTSLMELSGNGKWILYNYRQLYDECPDTMFLYNTATRRTIKKPGVGMAAFLEGGKYIRYEQKQKDKPSVYYLLDLATMKSEEYDKSDYFKRLQQTSYPAETGGGNGAQAGGAQGPEAFSLSNVKGAPAGVTFSDETFRYYNHGRLVRLFPKEDYSRPVQQAEDSLHLEIWKWDEPLSPRRRDRLFPRAGRDVYIYDRCADTLMTYPTARFSDVYIADADSLTAFLATDHHPWDKETDWILEGKQDVWYVPLMGAPVKVVSHENAYPEYTPDGRWAVFYMPASRSWQSIDMQTGHVVDITKDKIPYALYDEANDYPFAAKAYGRVGWDASHRRMTILDRYDLWSVPYDGQGEAVCLTAGYGRKHRVRFAIDDHSYEIAGGDTLYLRGFDERTKLVGFYRLAAGKVTPLIKDDHYSYRLLSVAADRRHVIWQRENFAETACLFGGVDGKDCRVFTDVDAPVRDIRRGTAQLFTWKDARGRTCEGTLYLPEGFRKGGKYPMIVNYYENYTHELGNYVVPEYVSAIIDVPYCVSNGYVVFRPDLTFEIGRPGESALDIVTSGVRALARKGYIDSTRVGLNGHSWGGYVTNFLVTHTSMFRCAVACSAVSNCISDYLMLRGTGQPNMYFEEDSQGRLGKTLWEDREMYIRESPIFFADRVTTPLLTVQGEEDTSVRADQAFAMFFAMRRLGKPAWLLNYRKEGHQFGDPVACRDLSIRMMQFLDHYLKDGALPEWMNP